MLDISKRLEKAEKYVQKGRLDDALEEYLLAFREDPSNDALVEIIAGLYLKQNQPKQALECYGYLFDKHVEQNNGAAAALMYRRMARLGLEDPDRLLICARFEAEQKPADARQHYDFCAQKFLERGDRAKALEALRGLATVDASNPEAHLRAGELAESLGQKELAAQSFLRASEILSSAGTGNGSGEQALALLERAHALLPADAHLAVALAGALLKANNADRAAQLLEPLAGQGGPERNRLLVEAYLAGGELARAEELLAAKTNLPDADSYLLRVFQGYQEAGDIEAALNLLRKLSQPILAAGKGDELLGYAEALGRQSPGNIQAQELLASLYDALHRDSMVAETLAGLFDLCLAAADYPKAANLLERLASISPQAAENRQRLQRLAGKLDEQTYRALTSVVQRTDSALSPFEGLGLASASAGEAAGSEGPTGSLGDMILQAELLLQFGSKEAAIEYLQGIARQFPGEESRNEQLRALFIEAGLAPKPAAAVAAATTTQAAASPAGAAAPAPGEAAAEAAIADMAHVSEITRNIHRQSTVKGVLSTCVNEIGKTWQVSRCLAGLGAPGKPPTAALEFCAPGIKRSDAGSIVKLVTTLVQMTAEGIPLVVDDTASSAKLSALDPVLKALEIKSLLALPLLEADQASGVVLLQQCDRPRRWRPSETMMLKTLVDQIAIATSHIKLRSLMKVVADERSGLLNRSAYLDCLLTESARAQEQNTPLSAALLRFGRVPRSMGEGAEQAMHETGQALMNQLRQNDIGVRYDPATLAVILPATGVKEAWFVVEKIRKVLGGSQLGGREPLSITVGIAEAVLRGKIDPADSVTELINRVEAALQGAEQDGVPVRLLPPPA